MSSALPLTLPQIATALQKVLLDSDIRQDIGAAAKVKSLSWTEEANAKQLMAVIRPELPSHL